MNEEFEVEMSPLCQSITSDGKTVEVQIYSDGEDGWLLEVIDEHNNSTAWEDVFETDASALNEVKQTIKNEGIQIFVGPIDTSML